MDRFIVAFMLVNIISKMQFKIQYGQIYRLPVELKFFEFCYLKSNMDRFIELIDEVIAEAKRKFKIQYGQIYSMTTESGISYNVHLKSNMDRFIVYQKGAAYLWLMDLKSNMDRFIDWNVQDFFANNDI